jgi:hypothetical protein
MVFNNFLGSLGKKLHNPVPCDRLRCPETNPNQPNLIVLFSITSVQELGSFLNSPFSSPAFRYSVVNELANSILDGRVPAAL